MATQNGDLPEHDDRDRSGDGEGDAVVAANGGLAEDQRRFDHEDDTRIAANGVLPTE